MDKSKYQFEGLKWLFELELLNHPQVINTIRFNVLMTSKHIKEVELLIYRENKSLLVLLELSWIGRKFYRKTIMTDVQEILTQLLPTFKFRVTDDPRIMELAVAKVKKALAGGIDAKTINSDLRDGVRPPNSESSGSKSTIENNVGDGQNSTPSSEKPTDPTEELRSSTSSDDSKKE